MRVLALSNDRHILETERLILRRFTADDADLMLAVWNDPDFVRYVGDRGVRTLDQARGTLKSGAMAMYSNHGYGPYCVTTRDSRKRIGVCGLFKRDNLEDPDIGFGMLPGHRRGGLAHEAAVAVLDEARTALGFTRVTAIVSPQNGASIALIEKLGLAFERPIRMPGDEEDVSLYAIEW